MGIRIGVRLVNLYLFLSFLFLSHLITYPHTHKYMCMYIVTNFNEKRSLEIFFLMFIYLFILAALGLRCCTQAFSSCSKRALLFVVVLSLLIVVASLVAEHGL